MKILQVIPYFNVNRGGEFDVCIKISKKLISKGHEVTILTTNFDLDSNFCQLIKNKGIEVVPIKYTFQIWNFIYSPSINDWLFKNIKNFDVIHLHSFRNYQNIVVSKFAIKHKIPYIVQAHGSLKYLSEKEIIKAIFDKIWGIKILKNSSAVISITNTESNDYLELGVLENKINLISNGLDYAEYSELPPKGKFRSKHQISSDNNIILYLGRLHSTKNLNLLVESTADILKKIQLIKLVIAGPDDGFLANLEDKVNKLGIENNVLITGPVYGKDKLETYVDADVFVTPSFSGFPITFLESCACGLPIITTDKGDQLEWLNNNVGLVVKEDKTEIIEAILNILKNNKLKNKFGENGKRLIQEQFNWNIIIISVENLYKKLIRSKHG